MIKDKFWKVICKSPFYCRNKSESGTALLLVLVLSAVALAIMTALIYLITAGTQTSGMQKRYRTALEAGLAGSDIFIQLIELRGDQTAMDAFLKNLKNNSSSSNNISYTTNPLTDCAGSTVSGNTLYHFPAKVMSSSANWAPGKCNSALTIDPNDSATYDLRFQLGSNPGYVVSGKIVDVVEGNTSDSGNGGGAKLETKGVVSNNSSGGGGEITVMTIPYQYTLEIDAESANSPERAKLSVLYQY